MDTQFQDSLRRLLIRLEDARTEVQHLSNKVEYPNSAKMERAYDAIETAEKHLKDLLGE